VPDVVKAYKEHLGNETQLFQKWEKAKPFEHILDKATRDPQYKEMLRLADEMYSNPALAQQYAQPQLQKPDPTAYDMFDATQRAKYEQDLDKYFDLKVETKLSSRFAQSDMQNALERYKNEFKGKFKDVSEDLDPLLEWAKEQGIRTNPYETAYKLKNWDNREAQLTEKIRKELTTKIEVAQNRTPTASPAPDTTTFTYIDVGKHIAKYGVESAEKKYGKEGVFKAVRDMTNAQA
jgi:hypothetical protein